MTRAPLLSGLDVELSARLDNIDNCDTIRHLDYELLRGAGVAFCGIVLSMTQFLFSLDHIIILFSDTRNRVTRHDTMMGISALPIFCPY